MKLSSFFSVYGGGDVMNLVSWGVSIFIFWGLIVMFFCFYWLIGKLYFQEYLDVVICLEQ